MKEIIDFLNKIAKGETLSTLRVDDLPENLKPLGEAINGVLGRLREEARARKILDRLRESYLEVDLTGEIRYVNESLARNLGYRRENLLGEKAFKIIDSRDIPVLKEKIEELLASGELEKRIELNALHRDGHKLPVLLSLGVLWDEEGKPEGIYVSGHAVSPLNELEGDARSLEGWYRDTLDMLDEAYLECDLRGNISYLNETACRIMQVKREEFIGQNFREFLPEESAKKLKRVFGEIYRTGEVATYVDFPVTFPDGSERVFELKAALLKDRVGNPIGFRILTSDVTQYRKAQMALAESERKYRMIVENMTESIWTMNFDLRHTYQSPSEVKMTGYTPEEILEVPIEKLLPPESLEKAFSILNRALEDERSGRRVEGPYTMELQVRRKDGTLIWEEITTTFQRDEEGRPIGLLCVGRDVTKRKELEKELEERERKYRMIVENMGEAVWIFDLDLTHEELVSPGDLHVTGFTPEEIKAMAIEDFVYPDSLALGLKILEEELARERSGEPVDPHRTRTFEVKFRCKDGGYIWEEIKGRFLRDEEGKATKLLMVGRNITERKKVEEALAESERKYRMIVENMYESVWVLDLDLKNKDYISPSQVTLTGYTPDEIARMPLEELVLPESLELGKQIIAEELAREASGEPVDPHRSRTFEIKLRHKDGRIVWEEITATFQRDVNGRPTGILLVGRDITERKHAEEEREKLERQLIQAQKMESIGRLAGGIAHDFNNILAVILGTVDVLKIKLDPHDPLRPTIGEIEQAALRARDITSQLLAFSRKQIVEPRVVNLNKIVERMGKTITRLIGEDIQVHYYLKKGLAPVKIDPTQVEQILMNLVVNARDAMPSGGTLIIETNNVTLDKDYCQEHLGFTPGDYVLLTVSDSGEGIPPEIMPYIFDPYFTTKEAEKGTGLGLATVYGIVKQNGGFINVYSELRRGTTVKVYLPPSTEEEEREEKVAAAYASSVPHRVLVVEDDPSVLEVTVQMLQLIGCEAWAATTPEEALKFLREGGPKIDVVLTDVIMPGMTGKELMERAKGINPKIAFIFMSGYTANVIAHHGILEEGILYLQKPFTLADLTAQMNLLNGTPERGR